MRGVVASEIGNEPLEAVKAQAIIARTHAWPYVVEDKIILNTSPNQAFRIERVDNPSYAQAYKGADATQGQVVAWHNKVVPVIYYADSNGGQVLASGEAWSRDYPYLKTKKDPWDYAVTKGKINGHRVGMSQKGAVYAAQQGRTAEEILQFYYPGTTIIQGTMDPIDYNPKP